jgi:hypothetical protein
MRSDAEKFGCLGTLIRPNGSTSSMEQAEPGRIASSAY